MTNFEGFRHGVGIGGWLTNYKRLRYVPAAERGRLSIGDLEHFDAYITERDVARIADWGMDHIRLAFDYLVLEEDAAPFVYREAGFRHLDNMLNWCRQHGLNLLLDLHRAPGGMCELEDEYTLLTDAQQSERFTRLWQTIAWRYAGEGGHLAFELLNELCAPPEQFPLWNQLVNTTLRSIREVSPDRTVVLGGGRFNAVDTLGELERIDDPRLVYNFHFYEPFCFTHQRAVINPLLLTYNRTMRYPDAAAPYQDFDRFAGQQNFTGEARIDRDYLRRRIAPGVAAFRAQCQAPLSCNEFGVIRQTDPASRENFFRDLIEVLEELDVAHTAWNYLSYPGDANRFSLVDDDRREPLSPELVRIIRGRN